MKHYYKIIYPSIYIYQWKNRERWIIYKNIYIHIYNIDKDSAKIWRKYNMPMNKKFIKDYTFNNSFPVMGFILPNFYLFNLKKKIILWSIHSLKIHYLIYRLHFKKHVKHFQTFFILLYHKKKWKISVLKYN